MNILSSYSEYVIVAVLKVFMNLTIDRSLPVPVTTQLKGQIEYGVAYGLLTAGSRLPNVKELATQLGMSPGTVSSVYNELRLSGVVESTPGKGTYVTTKQEVGNTPPEHGAQLDTLIFQLLAEAENSNLSRPDLLSLVDARANQQHSSRAVKLALIGEFRSATRDYAAAFSPYLNQADMLHSYTFQELANDESKRYEVERVDLVMTFSHRLTEVATLLHKKDNIVGFSVIPSERTRVALAQIDPLMNVGLISTFADFLHPLKSSVSQFAPHVTITQTAVVKTKQVERVIQACNVIVFATGAESILENIPYRTAAFEFRHVPDPKSIIHYVLPKIQRLRTTPDA